MGSNWTIYTQLLRTAVVLSYKQLILQTLHRLTFILPTYFTYKSYQVGSIWTPHIFSFFRPENNE